MPKSLAPSVKAVSPAEALAKLKAEFEELARLGELPAQKDMGQQGAAGETQRRAPPPPPPARKVRVDVKIVSYQQTSSFSSSVGLSLGEARNESVVARLRMASHAAISSMLNASYPGASTAANRNPPRAHTPRPAG